MIDIFLSASVPLPNRDRRFFDTADVLLIREAVKALVEVILPIGRITCGGHPAITPLLSLFVQEASLQRGRITIYQSQFFAGSMPSENTEFVDVQTVPAVEDNLAASLTRMRREMINSRQFAAAVLIGGMDGIFEEANIFAASHPHALVMPLASTGAAAAIFYSQGTFDSELLTDLTYASLFRRRLLNNLDRA